jgi:hypothetical protein
VIVARISDGEALVGARGRRLVVLARGLVVLARGLVVFEVHNSPSISAAFLVPHLSMGFKCQGLGFSVGGQGNWG